MHGTPEHTATAITAAWRRVLHLATRAERYAASAGDLADLLDLINSLAS
jgi:hypothetical protein